MRRTGASYNLEMNISGPEWNASASGLDPRVLIAVLLLLVPYGAMAFWHAGWNSVAARTTAIVLFSIASLPVTYGLVDLIANVIWHWSTPYHGQLRIDRTLPLPLVPTLVAIVVFTLRRRVLDARLRA